MRGLHGLWWGRAEPHDGSNAGSGVHRSGPCHVERDRLREPALWKSDSSAAADEASKRIEQARTTDWGGHPPTLWFYDLNAREVLPPALEELSNLERLFFYTDEKGRRAHGGVITSRTAAPSVLLSLPRFASEKALGLTFADATIATVHRDEEWLRLSKLSGKQCADETVRHLRDQDGSQVAPPNPGSE